MEHIVEIKINKKDAEWIKKVLSEEPKSESDCLGENETYIQTANFGNNIEMDIKLCGVQYNEDEDSNLPWTEAVLFDHGSEVCCSEPEDSYDGDWVLEYGNDTYTARIIFEE